MKRTFALLIMLPALSLAAQAQTTWRQPLSRDINNVQTEDLTRLTLVIDTDSYILLTPAGEGYAKENLSNIIKVKGSKIMFSSEAFLSNNLEVHLATDMLSIHAEDKSQVLLRCNADTLRLRSLNIKTEDMATVKIEPYVEAYRLDFYSEDLSDISHNGFYANSGTQYFMGATGDGYSDDWPAADADTGSSHFYSKADKLSSHTGQGKRKPKEHIDRSTLQFLWGWNNWGSDIMTGLMSATDGYEVTTTFSSYQLAYLYTLVWSPSFDFKMGVGYESDIYRFSNPIVELYTDGSGATAFVAVQPNTPNAEGRTRMVTRYVTLPLEAGAKFGKFTVQLAAIPGLGYTSNATGLKQRLTVGGKSSKTVDHSTNHYLNPYKLDARITLAWGNLGFFFQPSLLPQFRTRGTNRMDREVYPFKFGFQIGI